MRIYRLICVLFAILLWTNSLSQSTSGQKVIEIDGILGVFVPESEYRIYREDQIKGFTYYRNWSISEVQLIKCDSINLTYINEIKVLKENAKLDSLSMVDMKGLNVKCDSDLNDLVIENGNLRKKIKLLPWFGVGGFLLGAVVGILAP